MQSFDTIKMEDRKRSASDDGSRNAPPLKRQATVNGVASQADNGMPWKEDLEVSLRHILRLRETPELNYNPQEFTKDALQRRMREYKREAQSLSDQLARTEERATSRGDAIRDADRVVFRMMDEHLVRAGGLPLGGFEALSTEMDMKPELFSTFLKSRYEALEEKVAQALSKLETSGPVDSDTMRAHIKKMESEEQDLAAELAKARQERAQLSERLETASMRYMMAEKKIDRLKSPAVQKLEAAAMAPPPKDADSAGRLKKEESSSGDIDSGVSDEQMQAADTARKQAVAAKEVVIEQLGKLEAEHQKLKDKLLTDQLKRTGLTDEDFAHTDLFKSMRAKHDDVINRINDMQATHIQLREEMKQYQAERTSYKDEADKEAQDATVDAERQIGQLEADLARVRKARDDLATDLHSRQAKGELEKDSVKQQSEMLAAQTLRIETLESEAKRLQGELADDGQGLDVNGLAPEALLDKVKELDNLNRTLQKELSSMGSAWQKYQGAATKSRSAIAEAEERVAKAVAEKSKADQKYFGAMKAKDMQAAELRLLKTQSAKASEVMSQLKDAETKCRSMITHLEKQLAESRASLDHLTHTHRDLESKSSEQTKKSEQMAARNAEVEKLLKKRDDEVHTSQKTQRRAEQDLAEAKAEHADTQKSLSSLRSRSSGTSGSEFEVLKNLAVCAVCRIEIKTTALKTCGHLFCEKCIQDRITNRSRKCPNCGKAFGANDTMRVVL